MWLTMMHGDGVHALDLDDCDPNEQYIKVCHRLETGTPIKNQRECERIIALTDQVCDDDWLETRRLTVTDEYGRNRC